MCLRHCYRVKYCGCSFFGSPLANVFCNFREPDEISTDGGTEFTVFATQQFLKTWGVEHRVSSAYFPQSNGRAEVAVKAAKRLLIANVSPSGDLNNDLFLQELLQLRNTSDCDMTIAEIVFGHPLRNAFSIVNCLPLFTNRLMRRTWREFKNGGRGTKPTYIFLVIIPLLVIELKATPNGNPSDDFYWRQKSSSLNVVQYNTTSRPIIIHLQIYIA